MLLFLFIPNDSFLVDNFFSNALSHKYPKAIFFHRRIYAARIHERKCNFLLNAIKGRPVFT
ncbi:hypothetical protein EFY79_10510 [Hanamia caeni]|uniref:Uncharacterized protein n=1 Tax=Hanamia caeni TaxID=2294116 RepID=A0A3M9NEC4_9BACT|nr:hypothetical protein EFY79_10510 [Hanamia caeni]